MHLVLSSNIDTAAVWAYEGLKSRGLQPIEHVTSDHLAYARLWEHRVGASGLHVKIGLADGRMLCSSRIRGVLNRLLSAPQDLTGLAVPSDRDYANGELAALYLSWLQALPNTINRPTPQGLCGRWRHTSEWALLASQSGLATPAYRQSASTRPEDGYLSLAPVGTPLTSVIVLRGELYGAPVPSNVAESCRTFAAAAQTELLGIDFFAGDQNRWTFAFATPYPDLTIGGPPLLDGLTQSLDKGDLQ